jgi:Tfp pilus assembly protein PilO
MKNNKVLRSNIRASVRNYARFNRWDSSSVDKCVDAIIDHFELQLPTDEEMDAIVGEIAGIAKHSSYKKPVLYGALRMKEWLLSKLKEQ